MTKKIPLIATCVLTICAACLLAGCGANLDREITVQEMSFKVPSSWLESPSNDNDEVSGTIHFEEVGSDKDDDETADLIIVNYKRLAGNSPANIAPPPSADTFETEPSETPSSQVQETAEDNETVARTATEAIMAKQKSLEREYGVISWSINEDKSKVIDGAQVTVYEYSFVKDIEGVKQKYEYKIAYVFTNDMLFEISVFGEQADINSIVDSIEF